MPRNEIQRSVLSELVQWIKNNLEKEAHHAGAEPLFRLF